METPSPQQEATSPGAGKGSVEQVPGALVGEETPLSGAPLPNVDDASPQIIPTKCLQCGGPLRGPAERCVLCSRFRSMTYLLLAGFLLLALGFFFLFLFVVFVKLSPVSFWRHSVSSSQSSSEAQGAASSGSIRGPGDSSVQQATSREYVGAGSTRNASFREESARSRGVQWEIAREPDVVVDENRESQAEFIDGEGNLREGPGIEYQVLFAPSRGTTGTMLGASDGWVLIELENGRVGWTHRRNLRGIPSREGGEATTLCVGCPLKNEADLDGDGEPEELLLRPYQWENGGGAVSFALSVYKHGRMIWEDSAHEFPFFQGPPGVQDLRVVGDVNGDGRVEVVSTAPASDVSPTEVTILQWNGSGFSLWRKGFYVLNRSLDTLSLEDWSQKGDYEHPPAISWFEKIHRPGYVEAFIAQAFYEEDGRAERTYPIVGQNGRRAILKFVGDKLVVERWLPLEE